MPVGRLLLAPRVGKTKLIIDLIKRDKYKSILWVTPSAKLAEEKIPEEFGTWKARRYLNKLTTVTWKSLHKQKGHYHLIVLDEDQYITERSLSSIFSKDLTFSSMITMTGTNTKDVDKHSLYGRLGLEVLYKISINSAVDIKLLSNYTIKVVGVDMSTGNDIVAGSKKNPFMTSESKQYAYLSRSLLSAINTKSKDVVYKILARKRFIGDSKTKLNLALKLINSLDGRKLIFCANILQSQKLCKYTYNSKTGDEDLIRFQNKEISEIAMVNSGGIGYTYRGIDHLILVQADSDKNGATSQKICRVLLDQKNYKACIWVISLLGTQDDKWIESTLESFDKSKVEYINSKNM